MSLSQEPVLSLLKEHFVVGWKNIRGEDFVGASHGYECTDTAVGTTNGAGPRNTQMYMLSPDGVVLHCLPGFWHPEDLAHELRLGRELYRLWKDKRTKQDKRAMFERLQRVSMRSQSAGMRARSGWQGFDSQNERQRLVMLEPGQQRDTFYYQDGKPERLKPLSVVVHERMIERPFLRIDKFDTEAFIDYGRPYYDNNGGGVSLNGTKGYMESQKRMAERRRLREEKKRKIDGYYGKKPKEARKHKNKKG